MIPARDVQDVDLHLGRAIRRRRRALRLSQGDIAASVGVTFQTIEKYESGAVRLSASRLWQIAQALETEPSAFYPAVR